MNRSILVCAVLACALNASCALFRTASETPDYGRALPAGADALLLLGPDERRVHYLRRPEEVRRERRATVAVVAPHYLARVQRRLPLEGVDEDEDGPRGRVDLPAALESVAQRAHEAALGQIVEAEEVVVVVSHVH